LFCCINLLLTACATSRNSQKFFSKTLKKNIETSETFKQGFTGFHLLDARTGQVLCAVQADHYFTPASNTKILTLATCLATMGDSLTGFEYALLSDTVGLFRPAADPTFLHPAFRAWQRPYALLCQKPRREWMVDYTRWQERHYGPGWSWDDFNDNYASERSPFPIFGNLLDVEVIDAAKQQIRTNTGTVQTLIDAPALQPEDGIVRGERNNTFYKAPGKIFKKGYTQAIPLPTGSTLERPVPHIAPFLRDTLHGNRLKEVQNLDNLSKSAFRRVASVPVDTVYRLMMQESDNFLAEQLLLQCAWLMTDTIRQDLARNRAQKNIFPASPTPPKWVDGSGLSRYNLFTPQFLTSLLHKMYQTQPNKQRLFSLFPAGGISGTIKEWYAGPNGKPFVFAKTGTLSGVHCLSGYLVADSGRVFIFSFMHNNFTGSSRPWRVEMQRIFNLIREKF
jgi:serine-type D-Ala-D-Ala carboxypeptidase/endopeptidase (penicillin-binding protein 4)